MTNDGAYWSHIAVPMGDGSTWIEPALFYPNGLAVHRTPRKKRGHTLTHTGSGMRIRKTDLRGRVLSRAKARRLARALQVQGFNNWHDWHVAPGDPCITHAAFTLGAALALLAEREGGLEREGGNALEAAG
jgi:hypothetical protein